MCNVKNDPELLTVCSVSTALESVMAVSTQKIFTTEQIQSSGDLYYFKPNSPTTSTAQRTILYHENWLDMIFQDVTSIDGTTEPPCELLNASYIKRDPSKLTKNAALLEWAAGIEDAPEDKGGSIEVEGGFGPQAGMVEIVIGGAFISMLTRMSPSYMQYSASSDWYSNGIWNSSGSSTEGHYPPELMPEARIDCQYVNRTITIYTQVYGYQGRAISNILSMIVLFIHSIVAILGSIRQYRYGSIAKSWGSIPDYATLCLENGCQEGRGGEVEIRSKEELLKELVTVTLTAGQALSAGGHKHLARPGNIRRGEKSG